MSGPTITVVVPTVDGREKHLQRCVDAYRDRSRYAVELIVLENRPTCGAAWIEGAKAATGDYVHFSADDLEPHHGWDVAAVGYASTAIAPSPRILGPAGDTQFCGMHGPNEWPDGLLVPMSVIPFLSRPMLRAVGDLLDAHYFTDNWISHRLYAAGFVTAVARGFAFTHHWAQTGRGAGMSEPDRMRHDRALFCAAVDRSVP